MKEDILFVQKILLHVWFFFSSFLFIFLKSADGGVGGQHLGEELKHHESEDGGEVDLSHDGGDQVAEEVEVRVGHLTKDGPGLTHPVDVGEPFARDHT